MGGQALLPVAMPRSPLRPVLWAALMGLASPASVEEAVLRLPESKGGLQVDALGGYCMKLPGPFRSPPVMSVAAQGLGAWTKEQILCLQDADVPEASFTISPWPKRSEAEAGEFGFGPEVGVNLRPKIETSAVWPLQAQTPTLGIPFRSQAARLLALQATLSHQTVVELPLVAARFRKSWAIDVRDVNRSVSCEPEGQVGVWRIACRFARDAPVQLVVFCGPCARSSARMEIVQGKKRQETDAPWIGLTAEGPLQWVITVRETVDDREKVQDFVIAAVMGDEEVRWAESGVQRNVRIFGMLLAQATLLTAVALGFVSAPQTWPGLSSASLVLPYLALLAVREDAPVLLQSGFTWWPLSQYPLLLLMEAFALMLIVVVFHGHAALQFLQANGPGSAEEMPHGLSFGAWELRVLSIVAVPVGSAGLRIALSGFFASRGSSFFHHLYGLCGLGLLLSLLVLPWKVLQRLKDLFQEGRIIGVQLQEGTKYIDRVCDQLSSIPVARPSRILGSWSESASWQRSVPVAMIEELEHHGSCKERGGEPWHRHWSAGPWQPRLPHQPSTSSEIHRSTSGLRYRPNSLDSMVSAEPLIGKHGWKSPKACTVSPLLAAHPISVTTRFCFAERLGYAGVSGLSWLDAAVPSKELALLEQSLPQICLRVQACQLCGPFTAGRLSACFAAGDRTPWRWSYDVLLKAFLGCLVTWAPEAVAGRPAMQVAWVATMVLIAMSVPYSWPYVHLIDNLTAFLGALALPCGTAFYLWGHELDAAQSAMVVTLLLGYLPVLVALLAMGFSLRPSGHEMSPMDVKGWGELSGNRLGYERLSLEEDSPVHLKQRPEALDIHLADAVLLPPEKSEAPRAHLPCEVKIPLRPMHLWMKGVVPVSSCLDDRHPQVAVPMELLFGLESRNERDVPSPWATVLTPNSGWLLYRDQEMNGGLKWQEVLREGLHSAQPALLREAEQVLQEEHETLTALEILD
ncbi:unnamed protein product [Durusdinium trenchii]|uniref:Uncharacterized protein n=2 Tax=Durusdinium trenchii TaxID=1381693 RepID=A0ABP0H6Z7_9DINO